MTISTITLSVLNNLAKTVSADACASSSVLFMAGGKQENLNEALEASQSFQVSNTSSGGFAAGKEGFQGQADFSNSTVGKVFTTTGALNSPGYGSATGISFPSAGSPIWITPNIMPNHLPYMGDPIYNTPAIPNLPPQYIPFTIKPDLEQLEEGVHDIKGGKIIIKKIMVTEEQLDKALEEELGHEPDANEKAELRKELEELSASEEREI